MKLPQLYLRDLFSLVLVIALGLGWYTDRSRASVTYGRMEAFINRIYRNALTGKPYADVVREQKWEEVRSWNMPNLPPGADGEVTFYLDEGNVTLHFAGEPAIVKDAQFQLSDKSAEERFNGTATSWSDWVDAHSD